MKKLLILLLISFMLCGCKSNVTNDYPGNAKISDEITNVFFKIDGEEFTNNDIFQNLKSQAAATYAEPIIAKKVLELENYDFEKEKEKIGEQYDQVLEMYGEDTVKMYYGEKEDYIESALQMSYPSLFYASYIKKHISDFIGKYNAFTIQYLSSTNKKKMTSFQKAVKKNSDFEKAYTKQKFEETDQIVTVVYTSESSSLPDELKSAIDSLTIDDKCTDLIEIPSEEEDGDSTYYVAKITSITPEVDNEDDYINFIIQQEGFTSIVQVFEKDHTIEFYDEDFKYVYDTLKSQYLPEETSTTEETTSEESK